nr:unnamed protein product [Callosobruchus analis]CAI5842203.1 unnamed protein product [Callosobruchus analis]
MKLLTRNSLQMLILSIDLIGIYFHAMLPPEVVLFLLSSMSLTLCLLISPYSPNSSRSLI